MVVRIKQVVAEYEDSLRKMQWVPRFSYGRGMLGKDGAPNGLFLTYLFGDQELAIQFLKDVGLIRSKVQCNICERDTTWTADPNRPEEFTWRCRKIVAGVRCRGSASIRHGSVAAQYSSYSIVIIFRLEFWAIFYSLTVLIISSCKFHLPLRLTLRKRNSRLLQSHFRDVTLTSALVTEITLSRMTVALAAMFVPGLFARSYFSWPSVAQCVSKLPF
jgi:hypothetical protein